MIIQVSEQACGLLRLPRGGRGPCRAPDAEAISHEQITTHRHLCVNICLDTLDMCTQSLAHAVAHTDTDTLQGTNISHLGKRKIIFKIPFFWDMLVAWRVTQYSFIQFFLRCENLGTIQAYTYTYQGCNSQHMENSAIIRLHKAESKVTSKMTTLTNAVIHKPVNLPSSAGRCQEVTLFCICLDPCCHISSRRPPHQPPMVEA